jgi:CrcB protein
MDGLGKSVFTLSISLASLSFGAHLASLIHPFLPVLPGPRHRARNVITVLSILSYAALFPAYFRISAQYRHQATAALLFAFPGTLTRYLFSIKCNTLLKALPLGTFLANSLGTAVLAAVIVLQSKVNPVSPSACSTLQGLVDGYCGCLTTVSTFAVEIYTMSYRRGPRYCLLSWVTGQVLLVAILGSSIWSGRAREEITCLFD